METILKHRKHIDRISFACTVDEGPHGSQKYFSINKTQTFYKNFSNNEIVSYDHKNKKGDQNYV